MVICHKETQSINPITHNHTLKDKRKGLLMGELSI